MILITTPVVFLIGQDASILILPLMVICYLLFKKLQETKRNQMLALLCNKSSLSLIGNVHRLIGSTKGCIQRSIKILKELHFPVMAWVLHIPFSIIGTPENARIVLNKSKDRGLLRKFSQSFADGLLLNTGDKWCTQRPIVNSALVLSKMPQNSRIFNIWLYVANFNVDAISGIRYSMISIKAQLAYLFRNCCFTTAMKTNEIELLDMNAVLKCDDGYPMKLWRTKN